MLRTAAVLVALLAVGVVLGCAKRDTRRAANTPEPTPPKADPTPVAPPKDPPRSLLQRITDPSLSTPVTTPSAPPQVVPPVPPVTPATPPPPPVVAHPSPSAQPTPPVKPPTYPATPVRPPNRPPAMRPPGAGAPVAGNTGFGGGFTSFGGGALGYGGYGNGYGGFGGGYHGGVGGQPFAGGSQKPPASQPVPPGEYNAQNAEKYGTYRENEFRSPLVAAFSTFSADVNTASYSNVRRMLMQGNLPPKDAVFAAEFVNYFPYSYAQPKGDDPVAFDLEMGPCPWNKKHHLVRIGVQAYQIPADKMPPRNLVFLIDTSGSMEASNRLPLVKQSLALLVDQLSEKDVVSIVTYAGDSRVALGPTNGREKARIKGVVTRLQAQGGTNGEGGIKKAYELARDHFIDGGVNRVILCTDGDFNMGQTNEGELVRMIEEYRRTRVFLTILGFGMGNYKDQTLKELANHGNGHHAYIDSLDEAKKVFVEQGGALACVAKDVKFQVDFNPARVAAYRLIGYENRLLKDEDFKNDAKDAGDMGSGHQVTVLYEIVPVGVAIDLPGVDPSKYKIPSKPNPNAPDEWLTVKMRYKHPEADTSKELAKALPAKALGEQLSDDFRFAASAAAFGLVLQDSKYRGAMTYAGVYEEARKVVGKDPGGHRKEFLKLVERAALIRVQPSGPGSGAGAKN